ncbi:MAG: hypothetical protein HC786_28450 [Richelia sp. CSU_2_1]|nr:hypothetical protein [Richelia sp. CSU_2_1]
MPIRTNSEGLLEILHSETGAYVPASLLLQVEEGMLASLVPNQLALISDIASAISRLTAIESLLEAVRLEVASCDDRLALSNSTLNLLSSIDTALTSLRNATDSLEGLGGAANVLLAAVQSEISVLSGKLPASLGAKTVAQSLSVAIASDSQMLSNLSSIVTALSDGANGSVSAILSALSGKIPASLGAKTVAQSLSVAIASDSQMLSNISSVLSALSDGTNTALSRLTTVASAQFWRAPAKLNSSSPIINAATAATNSAAYAIGSQTTALSLQNFFSASGLSAQFAIELRVVAGATSLSDRQFYYRGDVASPFSASAGAFPGESPIIVPTHGFVQAIVSLTAISGGNVTTFAKELS